MVQSGYVEISMIRTKTTILGTKKTIFKIAELNPNKKKSSQELKFKDIIYARIDIKFKP
jgi:hypothetical protein